MASSLVAINCKLLGFQVTSQLEFRFYPCNLISVLMIVLAFSSVANSSHKRVTIDMLLDGLNKGVAVVGKVLLFVKHDNVTPL